MEKKKRNLMPSYGREWFKFNERGSYANKGMENSGFYYTSVEGLGSVEQSMDQVSRPLGVLEGEAAVADGVSGWNVPGSGMVTEPGHSEIRGKVISVTLGQCTRRIGIDGSPKAIKDAIKSAFGLRTRRRFRLVDENGVVRALGREMPLKAYTLYMDEGLKAKICISTIPNHMSCRVVEKTFYTEDEFTSFLVSSCWMGMTGLRSNRMVHSLHGLISDEVYHGITTITNNSI